MNQQNLDFMPAEANSAAHLFTLTDRLFRVASLAEVYSAALDALTGLLGCDRASILLFDHEGVMRFQAWRGLSEGYRKAVDGHSSWRQGDRIADPIFIHDFGATDEPAWLKQTIRGEGIVGLAFVPLFANGEVVGKFMTYFPEAHAFSNRDREAVVAIARQVGFSLERYRAEAARQEAEARLRESEERFRQMAEEAPIMIWISDHAGRCVHLNQMLRTFWGVEDVQGFDWSTTLHPEDRDDVIATMQQAISLRQTARIKGRYARHDGAYRVLETLAQPHFLASGQFDGMIGANVDITEREEADRHKRLLINELNHRVKNTLAVVQAVARQTFRTDAPRSEQQDAYSGRLSALAAAHNLLAAESWQSASLEDVARKSLNGETDVRIRITGPHVTLDPKQAVTAAMALHELYTNAVKHGSLRDNAGRVTLAWETDGTSQTPLTLLWIESGGPPIQPPGPKGFGSRMIEQALVSDLRADVEMDYRPTGLVCTVRAHAPLGVAG